MAPHWQTGYVLLVSNPWEPLRPASYLWAGIQWISDTIYNHCAIALVENGELYLVEALGKGVQKFTYAQWASREPKRRIKVIPVTCPAADITRWLGTPYDRLGLLSCLWRRITRHYWGAPAARADQKIYCYELIARIYYHPTPHIVLPQEVISFLQDVLISAQISVLPSGS
jgi:hypothetical protein